MMASCGDHYVDALNRFLLTADIPDDEAVAIVAQEVGIVLDEEVDDVPETRRV